MVRRNTVEEEIDVSVDEPVLVTCAVTTCTAAIMHESVGGTNTIFPMVVQHLVAAGFAGKVAQYVVLTINVRHFVAVAAIDAVVDAFFWLTVGVQTDVAPRVEIV